MLKIREEQMKVFEDAALMRFEDEMVTHSRKFTPRLCEALGEEQLRVALRQAINRAGAYGFTNRGPIRLYIELMFIYGSDFDTDPQYPFIAKTLASSAGQMERAEEIYQSLLDYQAKVSGPGAENLHRSLAAISARIRRPETFSEANFYTEILSEMHQVFPQKCAYIGDGGLKTLVAEACNTAPKYQLSTLRNKAFMVTLMFTLGHGCTDDPLYPWISRTLTDKKYVDPEARAKRLERRAATWLDQVLSGPWRGEEA